MMVNNPVALNHLSKYNKYQSSMYLIELLAKKECSVPFVSQYTFMGTMVSHTQLSLTFSDIVMFGDTRTINGVSSY